MQPTESANALLDQKSHQLLTDSQMQEPLLCRVFPCLELMTLAHLQASCRPMRALLDSELCGDIWLHAAQHLPPRHQQMHVDPWQPVSRLQHQNVHQHQLWLMLHPSSVSSWVRLPQLQPEELQEIVDSEVPAPGYAQQLCHQKPEAPRKRHLQKQEGHRPAAQPRQQASASCPVHVTVQQQLRIQAALLMSLSQGSRITSLLIKPGACTLMELWSPCGGWVAMQQWPSTLVICDMDSDTAQQINELPEGFYLKMAWQPATCWLLWVKAHTGDQEVDEGSKIEF